MLKGIDPLSDALLVGVDQKIKAVLLHGIVAEGDHIPEFPGGVYMEKRKGRLLRPEGLQGQVQHDGAVFAYGIEHDRLFAFRRDFAQDVDRLRLQLVQM